MRRLKMLLDQLTKRPVTFALVALTFNLFAAILFALFWVGLLGKTAPTSLGYGALNSSRLINSLIAAPLIETGLIALLASILVPLVFRRQSIVVGVIVTALILGGLHGLEDPSRAVTPTVSFATFTYAYLKFGQVAWWRGYAVAAMMHASQNFVGVVLSVAGTWLAHSAVHSI